MGWTEAATYKAKAKKCHYCSILVGCGGVTREHCDSAYICHCQVHLTPCLNRKWFTIRIRISSLIWIRVSAGSLHVVDSFPCWHKSFRQVLLKVDGGCMRNAHKSPKMSLLCNAYRSGKVIKNPCPGPNHRQKLKRFLPLVGPVITASFNEIGWLVLQ